MSPPCSGGHEAHGDWHIVRRSQAQGACHRVRQTGGIRARCRSVEALWNEAPHIGDIPAVLRGDMKHMGTGTLCGEAMHKGPVTVCGRREEEAVLPIG